MDGHSETAADRFKWDLFVAEITVTNVSNAKTNSAAYAVGHIYK